MKTNVQGLRKFPILKYLLFFILLLGFQDAHSQARFVVNNNPYLVLDNTITKLERTAWIISEVDKRYSLFKKEFSNSLYGTLTNPTSFEEGSGNIIFFISSRSTFYTSILVNLDSTLSQIKFPTNYMITKNDLSVLVLDYFYQIDIINLNLKPKSTLSNSYSFKQLTNLIVQINFTEINWYYWILKNTLHRG